MTNGLDSDSEVSIGRTPVVYDVIVLHIDESFQRARLSSTPRESLHLAPTAEHEGVSYEL
jgi:hypothetical protein